MAEEKRPPAAASPLVEGNGAGKGKKLGGVTGKGFMPGQSGNPGGAKKQDPDFIDLCEAGSKLAAEEIVRRLNDKNERERMPVQDLARVVVVCGERKWGKPEQRVTGEFKGNTTVVVIDPYGNATQVPHTESRDVEAEVSDGFAH